MMRPRNGGVDGISAGAGLLAVLFPRAVLVPVIALQVWLGVVLIAHAVRVRRRRPGPEPSEAAGPPPGVARGG